jgi:hypothetical protein
MPGNRGKTSLKCRRRNENPMREFDRLPKELRIWLAAADLPWRAKSVRRSYDRALSQTGDRKKALEELDRLQQRLVAKDAQKVWGPDHPDAAG